MNDWCINMYDVLFLFIFISMSKNNVLIPLRLCNKNTFGLRSGDLISMTSESIFYFYCLITSELPANQIYGLFLSKRWVFVRKLYLVRKTVQRYYECRYSIFWHWMTLASRNLDKSESSNYMTATIIFIPLQHLLNYLVLSQRIWIQ